MVAAALALTGCGGGSDSAETAAATPSDAGSGHAQALQQNTGLQTSVTNAQVPVTTIVVRASSTQAAHVGAVLQIRYNGVVIASGEVSSTSMADLSFKVATRIDGGMLDIVFTNAVFPNWTMARQLTVSAVSINGTALAPRGPGATYDQGQGLAAFDGIDVVPVAAVFALPGALRIPVPSASQLGGAQTADSGTLSAEPGPYVNMQTGSDLNPGTFERPYASLGKLVGRQLLAGENVHLGCGSMWRETLALGVQELADGTQVVPYGNDCTAAGKPVISGADQFNGGWTRNGAVWSRSLPPNTPKIARLWVGYTAMRTAQWPNADGPDTAVRAVYEPAPRYFWLDVDQANVLTGHEMNGASVLLYTQPWAIDARQIASGVGPTSELVLASDPAYAIKAGDQFMLRDKLWMLDAAGEFFHDVAAQRLYFIPAAADQALDINSVNVEGSVRDFGIDLRFRSNLVLRGVVVYNARQDGIDLTNAPQALVSDVEARSNGRAGIRLMQWALLPDATPGSRVENSAFAANGEHGIDATYVRRAVISNNRVVETGVGLNIGPVFAGIAAGPGATVQDNVIDGTGYAGIMFSSQGGSVVARNEISNYCQRLTDCGAIYSWTQRGDISPLQSSLIEGNRIHASSWNMHGKWANEVVAGIYLDDYTQRAVVRNNFLQGAPIGIFLHNAAFNTVENNQIWLARRAALSVSMDRTDADWSTGNILRGNQIVPMLITGSVWPALPTFTFSHPIWFAHALAGQAGLGAGKNEFVNNHVLQLNGPLLEHALISGPAGVQHVDIASWRQLNPAELDVERPATYSPYFLVLGPEKVPGGQFDSGLGSWIRHWDIQVTGFNTQAVSSQAGCNGPCIRMTSGAQGDALISPSFVMRPGVPHVYSWTAIAPTAAVTVGRPYIARESTWEMMNDVRGFVTLNSRDIKAGQSKQFEAFFTPKSADPAKVLMQLETTGVPVFLDAVSVREVQAWWFSGPQEWAAPVVATKAGARTVTSCAEFGWPSDCNLLNAAGAPLTLPFTVPAGSQQLVLWGNSPFRR